MAINRKMWATAIVVLAALAYSPLANADIVVPFDPSGWVVHNGTSITVGGTLTAPTVANDPTTVMAPFAAVTLAGNGDFVQFSGNMAMLARTGTGANVLNTQLRFGLFNGPSGAVVANDVTNLGFISQYANNAQGNLKVFGTVTSNVDPMSSGLLTAGTTVAQPPTQVIADPQDDSILGANPTAAFSLRLTHWDGMLQLTGQISGGSYLSTFDVRDVTTSAFPANGPFSFNRAGFFLGNNVNATGGVNFSDMQILTGTTVPESHFGMLAVALAVGAVLTALRLRRTWQHQG